MQKLELNEHLKLRAYDLHNQFAQKAPANDSILLKQKEADAIGPATSERHSSSRTSTLFYL